MSEQLTFDYLEDALNRLIVDHNDGHSFYRPPFLLAIIESDASEWLNEIEKQLSDGNYNSSPQKTLSVPKYGGTIRPGAILEIDDAVVYSAAVLKCIPHISKALQTLNPHPDYAYVIPEDGLPEKKWFDHWFKYYRSFTEDSISLLDDSYQYVVCADIAGYYENIDLLTLRSDLLASEVPKDILNLLLPWLHHWGPLDKRGIPQGYSASDVLGKIYLHPIDQALAQKGIKHLRWVDDFRIFVNSPEEGRKVLMELIKLLGQRGLVLQSSKTKILTAAEARDDFEAIDALLNPVNNEFEEKLRETGLAVDVSITLKVIEKVLSDEEGHPSIAVLETAYEKFFGSEKEIEFNKTLFRYLLNRLGKASSHMPLINVLDYLWQNPEETETILRYASSADLFEEIEGEFLKRYSDDRFIYEYQFQELLEWRLNLDPAPSKGFMGFVRDLIHSSVGKEVKTFAYAILGKWGNDAALAELKSFYPDADTKIKPSVICSLSRMEHSQRNSFYGRAEADSPNCSRAVAGVKGGNLGWIR